MRKVYFYNIIFLIFFFVVFMSAAKVFAARPHWVPELVLLVVILFALRRSFIEVLWFGFFAGFLIELFSGQFYGSRIIALTAAGVMVYLVTRKLTDREVSSVTAIFLVIVATVLSHALIYFYHAFFALFDVVPGLPMSFLVSGKVVSTVIMNLLFFYPLYFVHKFLPK